MAREPTQALFAFAACIDVEFDVEGERRGWEGCGGPRDPRPTGDPRLAGLCAACAETAARVLELAGPRQLRFAIQAAAATSAPSGG